MVEILKNASRGRMTEVVFNGPAGRLEGRYHRSSNTIDAPLALVLHPHPQYGGHHEQQSGLRTVSLFHGSWF